MPTTTIRALFWACFSIAILSACGGEQSAPASEVDQDIAMTDSLQAIDNLLNKLDAALREDPENADLYAQRGEVYYENGLFDKAIKDLRASIQRDSSIPERWHLLADAQIDGLRSREALNTMIYASTRFPERVPTLLKLAEFQQILLQHDDALATLDRALRVDPREGEIFFMIGQVLSETGDTARAMNAYQRATELNPDIVDAWLKLGLMAEGQGQSLAERYFKTATSIANQDALPYRMLGDYYVRNGRLDEAIQTYDEVIRRDPRDAQALYNSGLVWLDKDSISRAYDQFARAVEVRPMYLDARYQLGVALELQGKTEQARGAWQQALNLAPTYQPAIDAIKRLGKAQAN